MAEWLFYKYKYSHKSFTSIRLSSLFWRHQDCWNLKETAIVSISIPAIVKYICVSLKICLWQKNFKTIVFQTQIQINFIGTCRATAHYFILDTVSTCTFKILSSITTWSLSDNYDKSSQGVYTGFWHIQHMSCRMWRQRHNGTFLYIWQEEMAFYLPKVQRLNKI